MTAANDQSCALKAATVRVLRLNEGAERVIRHNESIKKDELWVGTGYPILFSEADDVEVYIRLANPQPIVAELVCAVIGRALGLPVPEPFIVAIAAGTLVGSEIADPKSDVLAFASRNVGGSTFQQLLRDDSAHAQKLIAAWEHLLPVAVFDEWVANVDRNLGNIIFAAEALWLIDHADAFGGSSRQLFELGELTGDQFSNKIATPLANTLDAAGRKQALDSAQGWINSSAGQLDLADAIACASTDHWQSPASKAELLDFVTHRLALTHSLLCKRLGHPQLYMQAPAQVPASKAGGPSLNSPQH